jgi:hypothetical protein
MGFAKPAGLIIPKNAAIFRKLWQSIVFSHISLHTGLRLTNP